ncbi:peptide chain release factor N(5)-glutamine methyltransferase [Patescibacteria group bacterium]|nr:peptide chain release factor N(5)-glutamine methyltransferase [Patescibacteria group bacterium]
MTIEEALKSAPLSSLEIEVLLSAILEKNRAWILAYPEYELSQTSEQFFMQALKRREAGEPIAYITGEKEFYGRPFIVNHSVLIPRPATEGLIECTLDFLKMGEEEVREIDTDIVCITKKLGDLSDVSTIIDVGTGSGCIAVTLALELPNVKVIAIDISSEALEVTKANAEKHSVQDRIDCQLGDGIKLITNVKDPFILISNPPYIPSGEDVSSDVHFEPTEALYAGDKGMDVLTPLVSAAQNHPACRGFVLECRKDQAKYVM